MQLLQIFLSLIRLEFLMSTGEKSFLSSTCTELFNISMLINQLTTEFFASFILIRREHCKGK